MKAFTQCLIGVLLFPLFSLSQDTLAYLSFNEKNGPEIREKISGISYRVNTVRRAVEHVPGFVENGLRTDGNSTWLSTKLRSIKIPLTISGWFALETFTTDTSSTMPLMAVMGNIAINLSRQSLPMVALLIVIDEN